MSKSGALAMKQIREHDDLRARMLDKGIAQVAREEYDLAQAKLVAKNGQTLVRMLAALELPIDNLDPPFVLDDFEELYEDADRVCVEFDGYLVNYAAPQPSYRQDERAQLIVGRCSRCGRPAIIPVRSLADFARPAMPAYSAMQRDDWVCSSCKRASA